MLTTWLLVLLGAGPGSGCEADLQAVRDASKWYTAEKKEQAEQGQAGPGQGTEPIELGPAAKRARFVSERFLHNCPEHTEAIQVRYQLGRLLYDHNLFEPALSHFDQIVNSRSGHELAEYAAQLSFDLLNLQRDFAGLEQRVRLYREKKALMRNEKLRETTEQLLPQIVFRRADHDLKSARDPDQIRKAARRFLHLAEEFPQHQLAEKALYNAAVAFDRAQEPYKARAARKRLLESYPESPLAPHVRKQLQGP